MSIRRLGALPRNWTGQNYDWKRAKERFLKSLKASPNGCLLWTGYIGKSGYGQVSLNGERISTHRAALAFAAIDVPNGYVVDHMCRTRACANPEHLRVVTRAVNNTENSDSPAARNVVKTHCKRGHEFTPENTRRNVYGKGRRCRACGLVDQRMAYRRKMARLAASKEVSQ